MKTIYGIFNRKGECIYVGKTGDLEGRKKQHRKRFGKRRFEVLATVEKDESLFEEAKQIQKFKAMGQAQYNQTRPVTFNVPKLLKEVKSGQVIGVFNARERFAILQAGKLLRAVGIVMFKIYSREIEPGKFKVIAL